MPVQADPTTRIAGDAATPPGRSKEKSRHYTVIGIGQDDKPIVADAAGRHKVAGSDEETFTDAPCFACVTGNNVAEAERRASTEATGST